MATGDALELAHRRGLDLIEVAPTAQPPVCRITDYGRYKYELEKKDKQSRQHQSATRVKEIKFHPSCDDHDFAFKVRHIRDFLSEGHRVKVTLTFRGREMAHEDLGYQMIQRVLKDVQDIGNGENSPVRMGRNLIVMVIPRPSLRKAGGAA
jgi:translation initiation factor IF-3